MRERTLILSAILLTLPWAADDSSGAQLTLASAQMGPVNQVGGHSLSATQWIGWRFEITTGLAVTEVGGHVRGGNGTVAAAIVSLASLSALPQGAPLVEAEVVAKTIFTPPVPSDDVLVPLSAILPPGAYALVIGSGQFEATGGGLIPNSGQPNIAPTAASSYIAWRQSLPGVFSWSTGSLNNLRFVVRGNPYAGPTDFNTDGQIDGLDVAAWRGGFGSSTGATQTLGNADGDGDVDGADFLAWQRALGAGVAGATSWTAAPEPTAVVLIAMAMAGLVIMRRRIARAL